jgi:hypothetical protein
LINHASDYCTIKAAYNFALGSLHLGRPEGVTTATEIGAERTPHLRSEALEQFWRFCQSDFAHFLGDERTAIRRSQEAFDIGGGTCLNPRLAAGLATRASMRLVRSGADRSGHGRSTMEAIYNLRETMELPEQIEALAAMAYASPDAERMLIEEELRSKLRLMPAYAPKKLETLGTPAATGPYD